VRAEFERVEDHAGDPLTDEASILTCGEAAAFAAATVAQEIARISTFSLRYS
jgi:hypothetical protein